jgi:hypothetical protein
VEHPLDRFEGRLIDKTGQREPGPWRFRALDEKWYLYYREELHPFMQ